MVPLHSSVRLLTEPWEADAGGLGQQDAVHVALPGSGLGQLRLVTALFPQLRQLAPHRLQALLQLRFPASRERSQHTINSGITETINTSSPYTG